MPAEQDDALGDLEARWGVLSEAEGVKLLVDEGGGGVSGAVAISIQEPAGADRNTTAPGARNGGGGRSGAVGLVRAVREDEPFQILAAGLSRAFALGEGENLVGRDARSNLWIDHPAVSRHHVRIVVCGRQATLEDLGSKNGTFLGEERVEGRRSLSHGDQIRIGPLSIGFRVVSSNGTTETDCRE